jgi:CHAT domain-containing protein
VYLPGGVEVTLGELLDTRLRLRLAVLSACETALPGTDQLDEVISLPTGLLRAGAAVVIATQWPVGDIDATRLMVDFARRWAGGSTPPAEALRQAQRWLRDRDPARAEISHWASYTFLGADVALASA